MTIIAKLCRNKTFVTIGFLVVACILSSVYSVSFKLADGKSNLLLFFVVFKAVTVLGHWAWLLSTNHHRLANKNIRRLVISQIKTARGLLSMLSLLAFVLFLFAAVFVEIAIVIIVAELGTIFFVLFMSKKNDPQGKYKQITLGKYLTFLVTFIGVGLVVVSQFGWQAFGGQEPLQYIIGLIMALSGSILIGFASYNFRVANIIYHQGVKTGLLGHPQDSRSSKDDDKLFCFRFWIATIESILWLLAVAVYFLVEGNLITDIVNHHQLGLAIMVGCGVFCLLSRFIWQKSFLKTTNLDIIIIGYITPILGIGWLSLFGLANVDDLTLLWLGTILVVGSNIAIGLIDLNKPARHKINHHILHAHRH